jgi:catechol 2,3-dioxygenase-like lactoylglutathione lyase family enzyme
MINGAHMIIYSRDADADRAFLRDVIGLSGIDSGGGWLIFALPPSEIAVHPADGDGQHEIFFMCDDVAAFVRTLSARGVTCSPVSDQRWGLLTQVTLPGGGTLGVYQPRHARPQPNAGRDAE